jgi:general secretion pathway protein G
MYPTRNRKSRSGGFTLIEVLLVLVILVVLASMAVLAYGPIQKRMRIDAAKAQIGIFEQAIEKYNLDVQSYPVTLEALRTAPSDLPPGKWAGPYLNKPVPLDPWSHQYIYSPQSQHGMDFDISCQADDGQIIGNWNIGGAAATGN